MTSLSGWAAREARNCSPATASPPVLIPYSLQELAEGQRTELELRGTWNTQRETLGKILVVGRWKKAGGSDGKMLDLEETAVPMFPGTDLYEHEFPCPAAQDHAEDHRGSGTAM